MMFPSLPLRVSRDDHRASRARAVARVVAPGLSRARRLDPRFASRARRRARARRAIAGTAFARRAGAPGPKSASRRVAVSRDARAPRDRTVGRAMASASYAALDDGDALLAARGDAREDSARVDAGARRATSRASDESDESDDDGCCAGCCGLGGARWRRARARAAETERANAVEARRAASEAARARERAFEASAAGRAARRASASASASARAEEGRRARERDADADAARDWAN
jgi:hypothetical protein